MNHFLTGFADELTKVGAFGAQTIPQDARSSGDVGNVLKKTQGAGAAAGVKGSPIATAPAMRSPVAPSPNTTPANMIDVASKI